MSYVRLAHCARCWQKARQAGDTTMPPLTMVKEYMRNTGWEEMPPGKAGSLWTRDGRKIGVLYDDDPDAVRGIVERLAKADNMPVEVITQNIRYVQGTPIRGYHCFCGIDPEIPLTPRPADTVRDILARRPGVSSISDDELDALYAEIEKLQQEN